ncbi:hypothetical protein TMatcc_010592 [Talaromyces marneffei ATCC 18224]
MYCYREIWNILHNIFEAAAMPNFSAILISRSRLPRVGNSFIVAIAVQIVSVPTPVLIENCSRTVRQKDRSLPCPSHSEWLLLASNGRTSPISRPSAPKGRKQPPSQFRPAPSRPDHHGQSTLAHLKLSFAG